MIYKAKVRRGFLGSLWLLTVVTFTVPTPDWFLVVQLCLTVFIVISLFTVRTFSLTEAGVEYRIGIGKKLYYRIRYTHDDVKEIKLGRVRWAKKGAIVKMKTGYTIRLVDYEPNPVSTLISYGEALEVPIIQTTESVKPEKK